MTTTMAKKLSDSYYGLDVWEDDDGVQWAVGSAAQANKACREDMLGSLWAFNADFIAKIVGLSASEKRSLAKMQEVMAEDCNELVRRIIGERNIDRLVKEATDADGRGHTLNRYDGKEYNSGDVPGLPKGKLAYRID